MGPPGGFPQTRGLLDTRPSPEPERQQVPRRMRLGCQVTVVTIATLPPQREQKPQHPHLRRRGEAMGGGCGMEAQAGGGAGEGLGQGRGICPSSLFTDSLEPLSLSLGFPIRQMWW